MKYIEQVLALLNKLLVIIGGIAVLALMSIATLNVCLRIINKIGQMSLPIVSSLISSLCPACMPYKGAYELGAFLGAVVTAFALGYTQKKRSHIVVDIFTDRYPEKLKRIVESLGFLVCTVFFAIIAWVTFKYGLNIAKSGEVSETLKIIHYPFILCVAIGFFILSLTLLVDFLNTFVKQGETK